MFPDTIRHYRMTSVTGGGGSTKPTFGGSGVESPATVQTERVDSVTRHKIRTPTNIDARTGDKIEWIGRTLAVEAATVPKGIGDVLWLTYCVETRG